MLELHTILCLKNVAWIIRNGFCKIQIGFITVILIVIVNISNIFQLYTFTPVMESNFQHTT